MLRRVAFQIMSGIVVGVGCKVGKVEIVYRTAMQGRLAEEDNS